MKRDFISAFSKPVTESGFGMKVEELSRTVHVSAGGAFHPGGGDQETGFAHRSEREMLNEHPTPDSIHGNAPQLKGDVRNGSVLIAAITSCHEHEQS